MTTQFLDQHRTRGHRKPSPRTLETYRKCLDRYLQWLEGRPPSAEAHQQFILGLLPEYSANYAKLMDQAVRAYHRYLGLEAPPIAIEGDHLSSDFLTEAQVEQLIQSCQNVLERTAFIVLYESALRATELVGIRWEDIDWEAGFVRVTRKGGKQGDVPLFPRSLAVLRELRDISLPRTYVFAMDYDGLYHLVRQVAARAGIACHPHALRHARAAQMRRRGLSLDRIQELLGHTDPKTTYQFYAHLTPVDLRREMLAGLG